MIVRPFVRLVIRGVDASIRFSLQVCSVDCYILDMVRWPNGDTIIRWSNGDIYRWQNDDVVKRPNDDIVRWPNNDIVRLPHGDIVRWSSRI